MARFQSGKIWMRKFFAGIAGILFAALILETSLRLFGINGKGGISGHPNATNTILCLGNSHTAGTGASNPKRSYPQRLEDLLRESSTNRQVRVINTGAGNANTSVILDKLDFYLNTYKPEIVVIMAGEPNLWNDYGLARYLKARASGCHSTECYIKDSLDIPHSLAIFRWWKLALGSFFLSNKQASPSAEEWIAELSYSFPGFFRHLSPAASENARRKIASAWKEKGQPPELAYLIFQLAAGQDKHEEADLWLNRALH